MAFIENLSFRLKVAIIVFLITFTFFMGFVLIEDLLIFKGLLKEQANWENTKRGLRVSFGFLFSVIISAISYASFNYFYSILRNMLDLVRAWIQSQKAETLTIQRKDEVGSFLRSLQILLYQEEEKNEKFIQKAIIQNQIQTMNQMMEAIPKFKLRKVHGLDFSILPSVFRNPQQDIVELISFNQGLLGILTGSDSIGFLELQTKLAFATLSKFLSLNPEQDLNQCFNSLNQILSKPPSPYWNYTCFTIDKDSGILNYISCQQIPFLVWGENGVRELDTIPEVFVDKEGIHSDKIYNAQIFEKEWLLLFSDRILKITQLNPGQFIQELKHRILNMESVHSSSRELLLSIAKHFSKRYGKKCLDYLAVVAIRRV